MTATAKMQTISNNFHNTEARTRLDLDRIEYVLATGRGEELARAKRQARGLWKKLCGIEGCTCGDDFGRR